MSLWFRMYSDVINDPKVQRLPAEIFKAWVNLLCLAAKNDGRVPSIADVAFSLRMKEQQAAAVLTELHCAGLLDKDEAGFFPHNWEGRQYVRSKDQKGLEPGADPKARYVYFITSGAGRPVKVGISKNPWARIAELQTSYPEKLSIVATFKTRLTSE